MKIVDKTQKFVSYTMVNSKSSVTGVLYLDLRGKHELKNKFLPQVVKEVINHINSLPPYESHCTRRKNNEWTALCKSST